MVSSVPLKIEEPSTTIDNLNGRNSSDWKGDRSSVRAGIWGKRPETKTWLWLGKRRLPPLLDGVQVEETHVRSFTIAESSSVEWSEGLDSALPALLLQY